MLDKLNYSELLGEVISCEPPSEVDLAVLRGAIAAAGFNEKMVRDMLPRHAFSRSARKLESGRVIKLLEDAGGIMLFQFTKEYLEDKRYRYAEEAILELDKESGIVKCGELELQLVAQSLIDENMQKREAADVTRIWQRIIKQSGDYFPVRQQGGVYFIPIKHVDLVDGVEKLMKGIGGDITRFPVPLAAKDTAAKVMITEVHRRIAEHDRAIEEYTSEDGTDAAQKRLAALRDMSEYLVGYRSILESQVDSIQSHLREARIKLVKKLTGMEDGEDGPE